MPEPSADGARGDGPQNIDVGAFEPGTPFSRWALARYIVGRVILERVGWALLGIAVGLLIIGVLCQWLLDSTFLAVVAVILAVMVLLLRALLVAVLHRLMRADAYGPLEDRLQKIIAGASREVLGEMRRVGLPSRMFTIPIIAFRLVGRRREETLGRMRAFDVDLAVPRVRRDELHLLLREATGRPAPGPPA